MNHLIHGRRRTLYAALSVLFITVLGSVMMSLADEPAPPTAPPADPSGVQERAVIQQKQLTPLPLPSAPTTVPSTGTGGPLPVVGGTFEPDYRYPWVVRMNGCGGVLIDPQWVLTAAHCVTPLIGFGKLTYSRTDPYTGAVQTETLAPDPYAGPYRDGVFIHPMYNKPSPNDNDIALIKLVQPGFRINSYLQTVGLPRSPRQQGVVGTLASYSHTGPTPAGQYAIFRGPIAVIGSPTQIFVEANDAGASLCPGDSGSGFVTVENGRAIVRGVASQATVTTCMTPSGEAVFTDVFSFHDWILQTIGKNDATLSGNTRVRRSGFAARGIMVMGCSNPYTPYVGPLEVGGVEEGAMCDGGQAQGIMCKLEPNQASTKFGTPQIVGFTMRTTMANGASEAVSLPYVSNLAQFAGPLPAGASREFTCQIGTTLTGVIGAITNTAVMSRGIEAAGDAELTVIQPSPFDPSEETTPKQNERGQTP